MGIRERRVLVGLRRRFGGHFAVACDIASQAPAHEIHLPQYTYLVSLLAICSDSLQAMKRESDQHYLPLEWSTPESDMTADFQLRFQSPLLQLAKPTSHKLCMREQLLATLQPAWTRLGWLLSVRRYTPTTRYQKRHTPQTRLRFFQLIYH